MLGSDEQAVEIGTKRHTSDERHSWLGGVGLQCVHIGRLDDLRASNSIGVALAVVIDVDIITLLHLLEPREDELILTIIEPVVARVA